MEIQMQKKTLWKRVFRCDTEDLAEDREGERERETRDEREISRIKIEERHAPQREDTDDHTFRRMCVCY